MCNFGRVMATSDHNMADSENSENSSEARLNKQTVRFADLIQDDEDMEIMTICVVCV